MNIRIPKEPEYVGEIKGDRLYNAISTGNINYVCRDWRFSEVSHQIHPPAAWKSEYLDKRRDNVRHNQNVRQSLRDLKGKFKGRSMYVILSGPSVLKNLMDHPPRPDDIVVGINRGCVFSPYPLDLVLVADGVVCRDYFNDWIEQSRSLDIPQLDWETKTRDSLLIMAQWADPSLKEMFLDERTYYFRPSGLGHEASYTGLDLGLPELEYAFNTGSMTLHLADYLGCSEIVLVGADMALTGGMFYPTQRARVLPKTTYMVMSDVNGMMTVTSTDMLVVTKKLEAWAWILKKYGVTCVNLTGEGLIERWFERKRLAPGQLSESVDTVSSGLASPAAPRGQAVPEAPGMAEEGAASLRGPREEALLGPTAAA